MARRAKTETTVRIADGKRFEIHRGDAELVCREMEENSFDAVLCDPPYGIKFMKTTWDIKVPGAPLWAEVLRVLKPGAPCLAFSATRTYHRLACAIEDGGFEIGDMFAWMYGCLSEDSEILTADGWKLGVDVREGDVVAAWDPETESIELAPVEAATRAPYAGELVRFKNDDVDQLLTPNHRVYYRERVREMVAGRRGSSWSPWKCEEAAKIDRWNPKQMPVGGYHDGPGIGGADYAALLGWIWAEGSFDREGSGVRLYQSRLANPEKVEEIELLISRVVPEARQYERERWLTHDRPRKHSETCWYFSGANASRVRADLPKKKPSWSLLWRMTQGEKRAFWDAAMKGDGSGCAFYQKDRESLEWAQALMATIGARGKVAMRRPPREGGSLNTTRRSTTEVQHRHLGTKSRTYSGMVWCVKVRTGAFVARRNGLVFITGNSGWPKGLDLSKAVDKRLGKPRGYVEDHSLRAPDDQKTHDFGHSGKAYATEPTTELGRQWRGYNTALKPGMEPACLAFKPFSGTYADLVLEHGVGGLNIDASRIGSDGGTREQGFEGQKNNSVYGAMRRGTVELLEGVGRYPSNVIVGPHDELCELVGSRKGKGVNKVQRSTGKPAKGGQAGWATAPREALVTSPRPDEEAWKCVPGCPIAMLDAQSGTDRPGVAGPRGTFRPRVDGENKYGAMGAHEVNGYGDGGGASRFFYCPKASGRERGSKNDHETVKPMDLMRYLARMLLPPTTDGHVPRILVPFCGSGSEMLGCMLGGWADVTGIERDEHNAEVCRWRVENAREKRVAVTVGGKK